MARNKGVQAPETLRLRSFTGRDFSLPIIIISALMLSYCARGGGTPVSENKEAGVLDSSIIPGAATVDTGTDVVQPYCGNGIVDSESEQCDITDLAGATCDILSSGTQEGDLSCNLDCTYNDIGCYDKAPISGSGADTGTAGYGGP